MGRGTDCIAVNRFGLCSLPLLEAYNLKFLANEWYNTLQDSEGGSLLLAEHMSSHCKNSLTDTCCHALNLKNQFEI